MTDQAQGERAWEHWYHWRIGIPTVIAAKEIFNGGYISALADQQAALGEALDALEIALKPRCDERKCSSCQDIHDGYLGMGPAQPTEAELAEAHAVLARHRPAQAAEDEEAAGPVVDEGDTRNYFPMRHRSGLSVSAEQSWQAYSDGVLCDHEGCGHVHEVMEQSDGKWYIGACKLCSCEHRYGDVVQPAPAGEAACSECGGQLTNGSSKVCQRCSRELSGYEIGGQHS